MKAPFDIILNICTRTRFVSMGTAKHNANNADDQYSELKSSTQNWFKIPTVQYNMNKPQWEYKNHTRLLNLEDAEFDTKCDTFKFVQK